MSLLPDLPALLLCLPGNIKPVKNNSVKQIQSWLDFIISIFLLRNANLRWALTKCSMFPVELSTGRIIEKGEKEKSSPVRQFKGWSRPPQILKWFTFQHIPFYLVNCNGPTWHYKYLLFNKSYNFQPLIINLAPITWKI